MKTNLQFSMGAVMYQSICFSMDADFRVTIRRPQIPTDGENDMEKSAENPYENPHEKLDILDMKILSAIKDNSKITHDELSKITGKHKDTIRVHLKSLREKGLIARIGPDKGGYWKVVEQKNNKK